MHMKDAQNHYSVQFISVQSLSRVRLFATPWTAARQASLSITNSWSLPKLMSIESVMPSSHLILCHLLLLLPPIPPSIRVFSNESCVGNLISGSSAFSKSSFNIWKFSVHVLLKPSLENFEHYFASMWNECNCLVIWTFFGIVRLRDWSETWPFPVLWPLLSFPKLPTYWVQPFHGIIFKDLKSLGWNSITFTSFVCSDAS